MIKSYSSKCLETTKMTSTFGFDTLQCLKYHEANVLLNGMACLHKSKQFWKFVNQLTYITYHITWLIELGYMIWEVVVLQPTRA